MIRPRRILDHRSRADGRLPTFLVIGAMKAGTTSLYHYLRAHPEVFMPAVKELGFFAADRGTLRGLDWYTKQFRGAAPNAIALGEASTMYTKHPRVGGVPARIARVIPDVRLVYVIRDPIDRIRSHYAHRFAIGAEQAAIEEAVLSDPIYVDCSRYAMQIEQYLEHFAPAQLLVVTSEDLRAQRRTTLERVFRFIGVDEGYMPASVGREYYRSGSRTAHPRIVWLLRNRIKRVFPQAKRMKELMDSSPFRGGRGRHRFAAGGPGGNDARGAPPLPEISDGLRDQLRELLRDDTARLRTYVAGLETWPTWAG